MIELFAYACKHVSTVPNKARQDREKTYHWPNVRMRHGVELMEVEFVVGADVDVRAPVLCHVAVFGSREHCRKLIS